MVAVIKTGGKQYAVTEKQTIRIEKLPQKARTKDNTVLFTDVLMVTDGKTKHLVGKPLVAGATVEGTIIRDARAKKVTVVKYKSKTRQLKTTGHRQHYTEVRIDKISAK